jgi:aspartyl-tRNA(Asn)/glutamyl-tRNA(Gln) amidotransferase subunit B
MALDCRIPAFTKWDRKSYYYPDLPKNYQISQYDLPLGQNGFIEIPFIEDRRQRAEGRSETQDKTSSGQVQTKRIGIIRAHLEEDAGKNLHATGNFSQVDLNRAGTPLLEIVTAPDINSGAETRALAVELQRMVRYLGVSEADMQKGHMRFEPNINLVITKDGAEYKTPIVEVKNLNSFRALERSIDYEQQRQLDEFLETGRVMEPGNKTTRGWDDEKEVTVLQREKEEAHDYRYFPEPDLVPVEFTESWLADIRARLCELPLNRQMRYISEYKLSDYDAGVLTAERSTTEFFDEVVNAGGEPKRVCNLLTQVGLKLANESGCTLPQLGLQAADVAELAKMIESGQVSPTAANTIMKETMKRKSIQVTDSISVSEAVTVEIVAKELNLIQKSDAGQLEAIVDQVLAENPKAVEDVTAGGKKSDKARSFLLGQVMQKTKGQANPKVISEIISKKLS